MIATCRPIALTLIACLGAPAASGERKYDSYTERYERIMEQYASDHVGAADVQLQKEWEGTVSGLSTVVNKTRSESARVCAMHRLRDMRAPLAVPSLITHITLRDRHAGSLQERLERFPAAWALAEIGQPAVRRILTVRLKMPATEQELGLFAGVVHRHYQREIPVGRFHLQHVLEEAQRDLEAERQSRHVLVTWEKNLKGVLELYDAIERGDLVPGAAAP